MKQEQIEITEHQQIKAILTSKQIHKIQELRDRETMTQFDYGLLIVDILKRTQKYDPTITNEAVYRFVAREIDSRSRSTHSMRLYHRIARLYPQGLDEVYAPLCFDHFVKAATYGERRFEVLKLALTLMDEWGGRIPSADELVMQAELRGYSSVVDIDEPPQSDYRRESARIAEEVETVQHELTLDAERLKQDDPTKDLEQATALLEQLRNLVPALKKTYPAFASFIGRMAGKALKELQDAKAIE